MFWLCGADKQQQEGHENGTVLETVDGRVAGITLRMAKCTPSSVAVQRRYRYLTHHALTGFASWSTASAATLRPVRHSAPACSCGY
jgi:hypothetical protein